MHPFTHPSHTAKIRPPEVEFWKTFTKISSAIPAGPNMSAGCGSLPVGYVSISFERKLAGHTYWFMAKRRVFVPKYVSPQKQEDQVPFIIMDGCSPVFGMCPMRSSMTPAMVSFSSSGKEIPVRASISSSGVAPSTWKDDKNGAALAARAYHKLVLSASYKERERNCPA